jgi:hypothetical protein
MWVAHSVMDNEAQCRVAFSEEFVQVVRHTKETSFEHLLTGDESWFYYECALIRFGLRRRPLFGLEKHRKFRPKCLISVIWSTSGILSLLALPAGMQYDAEFFCLSVLPDIERNLCDGKHRKMLRGAYLHLDNAPAHNAKRSR